MQQSPYPPEWYEEAFVLPGLDQGAFTEQSLEEIFREFDPDEKGFLTRADFRRMLNTIGEAVSEGDMDSIMKLVDPEGSGAVTMEQFNQAFMVPSPLFQNPEIPPGSNATLPVRRMRRPIQSNPVEEVEGEFTRAAQERRMLYFEVVSSGKLKSSDIREIFNRFKQLGCSS